VIRLIEIPNTLRDINAPIRYIGTTRTGIMVECQLPRKIKTTSETNINASKRVCTPS